MTLHLYVSEDGKVRWTRPGTTPAEEELNWIEPTTPAVEVIVERPGFARLECLLRRKWEMTWDPDRFEETITLTSVPD